MCGLFAPGYVSEATEDQMDVKPPKSGHLVELARTRLSAFSGRVFGLCDGFLFGKPLLGRLFSKLFKIATWLILPVVIRSSQRLSHACLSINLLL